MCVGGGVGVEAGSPGKQRQGKDGMASSSRQQNWVLGNSGHRLLGLGLNSD